MLVLCEAVSVAPLVFLHGKPATDMFGGKAPLILAIFGSATVLAATLIAQPWKRGPR